MRPPRLIVLLSFFVAGAAAAPSAAEAAPPSASAEDKRALDLFEQSARAYRAGRFQEAIDLLVEARKIKNEPVLLYNLARAYEALGKLDEAVEAYDLYLNAEPYAQDHKAIEGRISTLRRQIDEREALRRRRVASPSAPPERTAPSPSPHPSPSPAPVEGQSPAPWIMLGVGATIAGSGVAFGLLSNARHDDARSEPVQRAAE